MGGKTERIEKQSEPLREEDLTNALMKIVKGEKKTIYFTQGHGEKNLDDNERTGYSNAKGALEKENYVVKTVNLVQEQKVPDDAAALVIKEEEGLVLNNPTADGPAKEVLDVFRHGHAGEIVEKAVGV